MLNRISIVPIKLGRPISHTPCGEEGYRGRPVIRGWSGGLDPLPTFRMRQKANFNGFLSYPN